MIIQYSLLNDLSCVNKMFNPKCISNCIRKMHEFFFISVCLVVVSDRLEKPCICNVSLLLC